MKTYQPHPECMMQECMEEQGDYVLAAEAFERIDELEEACRMAMDACGSHENWNGETRAFLLAMEKAVGGK